MNKVLSIAAVSCLCMSCGNLSPEAKKMTGDYYNKYPDIVRVACI